MNLNKGGGGGTPHPFILQKCVYHKKKIRCLPTEDSTLFSLWLTSPLGLERVEYLTFTKIAANPPRILKLNAKKI